MTFHNKNVMLLIMFVGKFFSIQHTLPLSFYTLFYPFKTFLCTLNKNMSAHSIRDDNLVVGKNIPGLPISNPVAPQKNYDLKCFPAFKGFPPYGKNWSCAKITLWENTLENAYSFELWNRIDSYHVRRTFNHLRNKHGNCPQNSWISSAKQRGLS